MWKDPDRPLPSPLKVSTSCSCGVSATDRAAVEPGLPLRGPRSTAVVVRREGATASTGQRSGAASSTPPRLTIATPAIASAMPMTVARSGASPRAASTTTATTGARNYHPVARVAEIRRSARLKHTEAPAELPSASPGDRSE